MASTTYRFRTAGNATFQPSNRPRYRACLAGLYAFRVEITWTAKLIVAQQDMSAETLAKLRGHGVVENVTLLRIDFHYDAPGEAEAHDLAKFLRQSTDYEVTASPGRRSGLRRDWNVTGRTQDTTVSTEIINDWIRWMVLAGAHHGECRFDGWGAPAPA